MYGYKIQGGARLNGAIKVAGAKNHALKCMAAAILAQSEVTIERVPAIVDVDVQVDMLKKLGVNIAYDAAVGTLRIDAKGLEHAELDPMLMRKLRAAVVLAGPLLARVGDVLLPYPGGDLIGKRPVDMFLRGFMALGATVTPIEGIGYRLQAPQGLRGAQVVFRRPTVTGTEAMILAALGAQGETELVQAAYEPEIVALCDDLVRLGAQIEGIGTPVLRIRGSVINGGTMRVIPDRLEMGTFAIMGALTADRLEITDCVPEHGEVLWSVLTELGVRIEREKDRLTVFGVEHLTPLENAEVVTHEYPGFATDLQSPLAVLLTQVPGETTIFETIYENRLLYTEKLIAMGATIKILDAHRAIISGPTPLRGARLGSADIRAGAALVIAGLIATGTTTIVDTYPVERGYPYLLERLQGIGANIAKVEL